MLELVETAGNPERDTLIGPMKSLAKGLRALDCLRERNGVRTTDVAALLDIDKGLASRMLQTLVVSGYARQDERRRFFPGPKLLESLGLPGTRPGIRERSRPVLKTLVELTGESAHLGVLADDRVLYLEREVPNVPLMVDRPTGTLAPVHNTALGKVFLAFLGDKAQALPIPPSLRPTADELAEIIERGYAVDDERLYEGVRCAAAPILDEAGVVIGAISLSGPTVRIDRDRMHELGRIIRECVATF
jgi:IclR family acetate operon transcriptional repressor